MKSLEGLLTTQNVAVTPLMQSLGWATLLAHASESGNVELAVRAADNVKSEGFAHGAGLRRYREFFVLGAYIAAKKNPLNFLRSVLTESKQAGNLANPLWGKPLGYGFWRSVGLTMYFSISRAQLSGDERVAEFTLAAEVVHELRQAGEGHVSVIIGASLVRLLIDVGRDFTQAVTLAVELASIREISDARVESHLNVTIANALRCAGDLVAAEQKYRAAISTWPPRCTLDRNESLSLLAITVAKQGRHVEAAQLMRQAAVGYADMSEQASAARCRLEAASMWSRSDRNSRAVRELITVHSLVTDATASCPEWVLLGQLAMQITERARSGDELSPLPVPGFTLAIDGPIPEAKDMKPSGPMVLLAIACETVGMPHRAAYYFRLAISESDAIVQAQTASIAFRNAIVVGDLARAAYLAALASRAPVLQEMSEVASLSDSFNFRFLFGPVVFAAINQANDRVRQLDAAVTALADPALPDNQAVNVLRTVLEAIVLAERDGDLDGLEAAYRTASTARAWVVARHLAWFWLFRCMWGRPVQEGCLIRWLWRYCWLTMLVGDDDTAFFASSAKQLKMLLSSLGESSRVEVLAPTSQRVSHASLDPVNVVRSAAVLVSEACASCLGVGTFLAELGDVIRSGSMALLGDAVDIFVARVLGLILMPLANEHSQEFRDDITGLTAALSGSEGPEPESLRRWRSAARKLLAMIDTLETGQPSPLVFDALLEWRDEMPPKLPPTSAANYYAWLRHMFVAVGRDPKILSVVWNTVGGQHAASLLHHPEVPGFLRRRLGVCHWTARGHLAFHRCLNAASIIGTQQESEMPVRVDVWDKARQDFKQAMADVKDAVHRLADIESDDAQAADASFEDWSCRMESGTLRQMVGAFLWKRLGNSAAVGEWLRPAIEDFREAVRLARTTDLATRNASMLIRPAVQGRFLARTVGDRDAEQYFDDVLVQESTSPERTELVRQEAASAESDVILGDADNLDHRAIPYDEAEFVDQLVDHVMKSHGFPEDRRPFVRADAKKVVFIERVQQKFCRHLQPLQDLRDTRSPATAYTGPTYYTGACRLLGHQTQVEVEDIEAVISSFQRLYCENCQHRSPKASP